MLLTIDAGNTNVVFAVYDGQTLEAKGRLSTDGDRTVDEYAVWLSQFLQLKGLRLEDIGAAIISCVVPPALFGLRRLCRDFLGCEALVVGERGVDPGIDIRIDTPSAVGADRIANAVGAHARYDGALIVIDFGTATTLDVVGADGAYEGGIIAPGVKLSLEALFMAAAKLPHIAIEPPVSVIGKGTVHAMQSGVFFGYVSMIEGLVARIKKEYGKPLKVIATGGLSPLFDPHTPVIEHVEEDLTIDGLRLLFERNRKNRER